MRSPKQLPAQTHPESWPEHFSALQMLPNTAPVLRRENVPRDPNYRFPGGPGRHPTPNSPSETRDSERVSPQGSSQSCISDVGPFIYPGCPFPPAGTPVHIRFLTIPPIPELRPCSALQILPNTAPILRRENTLRDLNYRFIFRNYRFPGGSGRHHARNSPSETRDSERVSHLASLIYPLSDGKREFYTP